MTILLIDVYYVFMNNNCSIEKVIVVLKTLVDEVSDLLDDEIEEAQAHLWREKASATLSSMFGEDNAYTKDFASIEFTTHFMEGLDDILLEETFRLGLEDSRSYLVALVDVYESEHNNSPGLMDMESIFAEMNRYVSINIQDPTKKISLNNRITRLRDGMISGDISGVEIQNHVKQIGYMDPGLFERIVPLLTWFYMNKGSESDL